MATTMKQTTQVAPELENEELKKQYLDAVSMVEMLHRRLLDVVKDEFERMNMNDVNPVQALLLYNMGDAELTAGELRNRGYYHGSNVSYNLKKLVDLGYINHERSKVDKRSVRVSLTEKGRQIHNVIDKLYSKHIKSISVVGGLSEEEFVRMNQQMRLLDRFWVDQIRYRL